MAEGPITEDGPEPQVTFNIKSGSEQKHVLTLPLSTTIGDVKEQLSKPEHADISVDRQRLIFSGRILKNEDTLEKTKVKDGQTIHLVKSAASNARQNPTGSSGDGVSGLVPTPAVPTNIAAGTGNSPFAQLTGARHAGFHGLPDTNLFGPDGGMGPPPNPDDILQMLDNPNFLSQMNEMMNNPAMVEMLLNSPSVRNNPQARMMLQNPEMRRMMLNPDMIRMQFNIQRVMSGGDAGNFAMPGETDTTAQTGAGNTGSGNPQGQQQQPTNPLALLGQGFGAPGGGANPFAALFNPQNQGGTPFGSPPPPASTGQGTPAGSVPSGQDGQNQANSFSNTLGSAGASGVGGQQNDTFSQQMMPDPELMRRAMEMARQMGGQGAGATGAGGQANLFASLLGMGGFGDGGTQEPPDTRSPEERYESQLRQLNDMGFFEFERNVQALRRSGGSVQGAIEYLLNN